MTEDHMAENRLTEATDMLFMQTAFVSGDREMPTGWAELFTPYTDLH